MSYFMSPANLLRAICHCCGGAGWMTSTQQCGVCMGTGECSCP